LVVNAKDDVAELATLTHSIETGEKVLRVGRIHESKLLLSIGGRVRMRRKIGATIEIIGRKCEVAVAAGHEVATVTTASYEMMTVELTRLGVLMAVIRR